MKKLISFVLLLSVLCLGLAAASYAADTPERLVDEADILTASEEKEIAAKLDEISEKHKVDVVIVTVDSVGYKTPQSFADDYYDYNGYQNDGVLLLISMEERDWYISTAGLVIDAVTSSNVDYIGDVMTPYLSDGNYAEAFRAYANECEYYINGYINGFPFDVGMSLVISLVIGLVVAFIVTMIMKGQLKSVRANDVADEYVKKGSMNVTLSRDLFLYRHITRREKPKDNDSHRSSSGRSHGGGGGKF